LWPPPLPLLLLHHPGAVPAATQLVLSLWLQQPWQCCCCDQLD